MKRRTWSWNAKHDGRQKCSKASRHDAPSSYQHVQLPPFDRLHQLLSTSSDNHVHRCKVSDSLTQSLVETIGVLLICQPPENYFTWWSSVVIPHLRRSGHVLHPIKQRGFASLMIQGNGDLEQSSMSSALFMESVQFRYENLDNVLQDWCTSCNFLAG